MEEKSTERTVAYSKCGTVNANWLVNGEKCGEDLHKKRRGARFWVAFALGTISTLSLVC